MTARMLCRCALAAVCRCRAAQLYRWAVCAAAPGSGLGLGPYDGEPAHEQARAARADRTDPSRPWGSVSCDRRIPTRCAQRLARSLDSGLRGVRCAAGEERRMGAPVSASGFETARSSARRARDTRLPSVHLQRGIAQAGPAIQPVRPAGCCSRTLCLCPGLSRCGPGACSVRALAR